MLTGDAANIRFDQRLAYTVSQAGREGPAQDLQRLNWFLRDQAGRLVASGASETPDFLIDLGVIERERPYDDLELLTKVWQRSGTVSDMPAMTIPIERNEPVVKLLIDGDERAAANLVFGDKLTIQDRSTGDIVERRWIIEHVGSDGNTIETQPIGDPYVPDLPVSSRQWRESLSSEYRVNLMLTDPEGQTFTAARPLVVSMIPPRPWWMLGVASLLVVPLFWKILPLFLGNAPRFWTLSATAETANGAPLFPEDDAIYLRHRLRKRWSRRRKEASLSMASVFGNGGGDGFWNLDADETEIVVRGMPRYSKRPRAEVVFRPSAKHILYAEPSSGDSEQFYFHDPDHQGLSFLRVHKNEGHSWGDRLGITATLVAITAILGFALYWVNAI